jgi:organic radical activating enzyme
MPAPTKISYPLMEAFYTIQGEGFNTGKAAYFIRLGGCDVGCVWCDVKDSWEAENHPMTGLDEIINGVVETGADKVVITGGEPAMYDLRPLTEELKKKKIDCYLETSGAYPLTGSWDWVCISPKKFMNPIDANMAFADELKVVIYNKSDFDWAEKYARLVNPACKLFLQPEYSVFEKVMPAIIDYVKQNVRWRISLQVHKIIGVR